MFLVKIKKENNTMLDLQDYLQESLILEEEWSMIIENTMTKQHIALMENNNMLLREANKEGKEKSKSWFKKAWITNKKFFKFVFEFFIMPDFAIDAPDWVRKNEYMIRIGAQRMDERGSSFKLTKAGYDAIMKDSGTKLNREAYMVAEKLMQIKTSENLQKFLNVQGDTRAGSSLVYEVEKKLDDRYKALYKGEKKEYKATHLVNASIKCVLGLEEKQEIYKKWEYLFDRNYREALDTINRSYDDGRSISDFKTQWSIARKLLTLSWEFDNYVADGAVNNVTTCFAQAKIKDIHVKESYNRYR